MLAPLILGIGIPCRGHNGLIDVDSNIINKDPMRNCAARHFCGADAAAVVDRQDRRRRPR
jgi:hypothetical protein